MLQIIQQIDEKVLQFIHITCSNSFFDFIMPWLRNPYTWAPLYLFLLVWMWQTYGKKGLIWSLFFFLTFVFCDSVSASIIKPLVHRIRPCNETQLSFVIRHLIDCGSGFSFPSSHATNHFGLSAFLIFTLGKMYKWVIPFSIIWAVLVCYAQLYVAVHYPSDILVGALLGFGIGVLNASYFKHRFGMGIGGS